MEIKLEQKEIEIEKEKNIDAIYIHIPFCDKKCDYCDFCTFIKMEREYRKYVDYLIKEIRMYPKYKYDTIYFGGGTPSLLPTEMIREIMDELKWSENAEITLELNPFEMTLEKLKEIRGMGINRLSIGIQSFQNHVLKFIGRQHSSEDAVNVFEMARKAGFHNITIDLMFGIPNQTIEDLQKDLEIIKSLEPENVSIYSLIWEEGTVFWSKLQKGILSEIDQDVEAEMYEMIIDFFKENGYSHYEISNFSRIDKNIEVEMEIFENEKIKNNIEIEKNLLINKNVINYEKSQINSGRHNLKYWRNQEFIGVGMSAASYYGKNRHSNVRTFKKYYEFLDNEKLPIDEKSVEIVDEIEKEKLRKMLGLRLTEEGIEYFDDEKVEKLINNGLLEKFVVEKIKSVQEKKENGNKKNINFENKEKFINKKENLVKYKKNTEKKALRNNAKSLEKSYETRIRLTKKGMLLANDVFVEFI